MKRLHSVLAAVIGLLLLSAPLSAQTNLTSTTISGAITNVAQQTIVVASATGITTATGLFIPATGEYMRVTTTPTSTLIRVQRGANGTRPYPIANSATVIIVPVNATVDYNPVGACSGVNAPQYYQLINLTTADVNVCMQGSSLWETRNQLPLVIKTTVVLTR